MVAPLKVGLAGLGTVGDQCQVDVAPDRDDNGLEAAHARDRLFVLDRSS